MRFTKRFTYVAAGTVLAVAVAVTGCAKKKDPKEVVIEAFGKVYSEDQVSPLEEIFGTAAMNDMALNENTESGITVKLESCSSSDINIMAGSGLSLSAKSDKANGVDAAELAVIYNGMDLATMEMYYGDETILVKIPELSSRVLTLDVSEGLIDRVKESPLVGPIMEQSGVDLDELADYFNELTEQSAQDDKQPFDAKALWKRYKEGSQAQENFKAALTVEKLDTKETFTVDGKEVSCEAYQVLVSKDSMIEFLRTSSDFFLQDEEWKEAYLKQLETTVKLSEMLGSYGTGYSMISAEEMMASNYEELQEQVETAITYLEKALNDVNMTVYVTKDGHLAAIDGTTTVTADSGDIKSFGVAFHAELQGGAFSTQNASGEVILSNADEQKDLGTFRFVRNGVYNKEQWTSDLSLVVEPASDKETFSFTYSGTYNLADRDFHMQGDMTGAGQQLFKFDVLGAVDELEKGKSFRATFDNLEASVMEGDASIVFSGELYFQPLEGEITAPQGTQFDVLAATEADWMSIIMEAYSGITKMAEQLGLDL
ncbi:MAG: zinc ribbon domain-containing protein [Lachnospiraceae bacterium]